MVTKKEAVTLGLIAIGGLGVASMVAGKEDVAGSAPPYSAILPGGSYYKPPSTGDTYPTNIIQLPSESFKGFPEPQTFDFSSFFPSAAPTPTPTPTPTKKEQVVYGGYMPSGKTYVFGGKAFETQAAKEIVKQGYSPTLAASFGISPEIAGGGTTKKKSSIKKVSESEYKSFLSRVSKKHRRSSGGSRSRTRSGAKKEGKTYVPQHKRRYR